MTVKEILGSPYQANPFDAALRVSHSHRDSSLLGNLIMA